MVKEAEFVQKAIDMLLDLKQKQANIVEAEFARKQSEVTAKQGGTIMVFTVVTILFVSAYLVFILIPMSVSDIFAAPRFFHNQSARVGHFRFPSCGW